MGSLFLLGCRFPCSIWRCLGAPEGGPVELMPRVSIFPGIRAGVGYRFFAPQGRFPPNKNWGI